jgi:hypothetical protein
VKPVSVIALGAALSLAFAMTADAAPSQAKPAHAKPSIDGVWAAGFVMTMEASKPGPLVVSEAEAKVVGAAQAKDIADFFGPLDPEVPYLTQGLGLPLVRGERRTRLIVQPADGKLPYTEAFQKAQAAPQKADPARYDDPERRPNAERCLAGVGQPPITSLAFASNLQILRGKDAVVIHTEYGDEVRVVPITDRHRPKALWGTMGDSIGRWEGNTLVVETVGQPEADRDRFAPLVDVSGAATVVERFTAVSDRELLYQFTVIDPKVYAKPWMGEFSWYRTDKLMYEHACHEGNHSLPDILAGARYREAERAKAAGK